MTPANNNAIVQRYRGGVPNSVVLYPLPLFDARSSATNLALFAQDSWKIRRLTLNPGIRFDRISADIPAVSEPAGPWVPAREFAAVTNIPVLDALAPRFGAAYDVSGDGKTVVKASAGRYVAALDLGYPSQYNPVSGATDTRNWTDLNNDDLAQLNELGPTQNASFGKLAPTNATDPNLHRESNNLYNVTLERELRSGLAVGLSYNKRTYSNLQWTDNRGTNADDYLLLTTADPRGSGAALPVYSLVSSKLSVQDNFLGNSDNTKLYSGLDVTVRARLKDGTTLSGGTSTGRTRNVLCEVENLNSLRFCDERQYGVPFQTAAKFTAIYPIPVKGGFQVSTVFSSTPGSEFVITYPVTRTQLPTLTASSVSVRLNEPGSDYLDRVNQLDISFSGTLKYRSARIKPQVSLFNSFNKSTVLSKTAVFGPSLGNPLQILDGRLLRLGATVDF
jgi:hypothetical protein